MIHLLFFISSLWADQTLLATGSISKEKNSEIIYLYERYHDSKSRLVIDKSIYKEAQGKTLVEETMKTENGVFLRYDIKQRQSLESGWIAIQDEKVTYGVKDDKGKSTEVRRAVPKDFIVPLQLHPFIKKNWKKLLENKSVSLKLGVWKRQDHYSFFMKKVSSKDGLIVIKMQLSNIILRAFTSPLYFKFDKKTHKIRSYTGPLNLKKKKEDGFTDFIGYVEYDLKKEI